MRVIVLSILLGLALCSTSTDEFLDAMTESEFGKTVLQTIQLELGSNGQEVGKVVNLLEQMKQDLEEEQKSESTKLESRSKQCSERAGEAQKVATAATERRVNDEKLVPLKEEELRDKQTQLLAKRDEEQRNNDRIVALTEARKQTRAQYAQRREELTAAVGALQEAKQIVSQLKNSGFLQLSEPALLELKDQHQKFLRVLPKQLGFHSMINLLFTSIQDKSLKADQGIVDKLLNVIDELVQAVYDLQKQEMRADDNRERDFIGQKTRIEWATARIATSTAQLNADVSVLTQRLLELQNDIATQQQIIDSKTQEKKDWTATCSDAQAAFGRMSANRKEQLELILKALQIFKSDAFNAVSYIQSIRIR